MLLDVHTEKAAAMGNQICQEQIMNYQNKGSKIEIRRSRTYAVSPLLVSVFIALLSYTSFMRSEILLGSCIAIGSVVLLALGIFLLNDRSPQIVLNDQCIFAREIGKIPWKKIQSVRLEFGARGLKIMVLELRGYEKNHVRFQVHGLEMSPGEIHALITSYIYNDE